VNDTRQDDRPLTGLRERKKARTRAAIRRHALRLFREQGYTATTVEQIAEAAEVSPSTFFRYFPTKEDVVLQDDIDVLALELFEAQPAGLGPIAAFRAASASTFAALTQEELDRLRETTALTMSIPEVRARALDEFTRTIDAIAAAVAKRTGRTADDFAVRNVAGAIIGVMMAVSLPLAAGDPDQDWLQRVDAALAHLDAGLPLGPGAAANEPGDHPVAAAE
jgi:AcrR family transcriptional regulator